MRKDTSIGFSGVLKLSFVISLLIASCTPASSPPTAKPVITSTTTPEATQAVGIPSAEIDPLMNGLVEQTPLAGIALGVQFRGASYVQGYGLADLEGREPVTTQTVFKIASLTKAITATGILKLSDEGKLGLDDPISRLLPQAPSIAQGVLVRHLLNHTSGLPDWSIDAAQEALPEPFTTGQAVEYYFSTVENLDSEPGHVWSYSNAGYFLLGAIIENLSGMAYDEYFKTAFFQPLALNSLDECPSQPDLLATGNHSIDGGFEVANPSNLKLLAAAGGLCSNIEDILKWQVALTHGETIDPEIWNQISTPGTLSDGRTLDYGFGVSVQMMNPGLAMMHDGAAAGFNSFFIYYPEHDLNIVLLTNTDGFDSHLRAISSLIVAKLLRLQ